MGCGCGVCCVVMNESSLHLINKHNYLKVVIWPVACCLFITPGSIVRLFHSSEMGFVMDAKPVFKCVYVLCPWTDSGCVSRDRGGLIHPHPVYYVQSCLVSLSPYKLFEEVSEGRNK